MQRGGGQQLELPAGGHLATVLLGHQIGGDPHAEARDRLRERFPDREPVIRNLHSNDFFEPVP